jgi:amidase
VAHSNEVDRPFFRHSALELADWVRRGEVSAAELLEEFLARIERLNPVLNAVVHRMDAEARALARRPPPGPFTGVPFLVKDLIGAVAGQPFTSASRFLRSYVPDHDSELVRRYRRAGLIIAGKSNTSEFGLLPFVEPELFGPTRNPWDLALTPGGSSGGSAAAVAAGLVPIAGGGDGGGSIRIPASCCGVFGFKPTRGRTPTGPDHGQIWKGAVQEHVLTRHVADSAAMLDAVSGPDTGAPYFAPPPERPFLEEVGRSPGRLRIAFTARPLLGRTMHPDCVGALESTAKLLADLGHDVEEAAPEIDRESLARSFFSLIASETAADLADAEKLVGRKATRPDFEVTTWALKVLGDSIPAVELACAERELGRAARRIGAFFERFDVLLTPTVARPPFPIGELQPSQGERLQLRVVAGLRWGWLLRTLDAVGQAAEKTFDFIPTTPVFNITGQPAMSVPLAWNEQGLPIGMHFAGRTADEATLFRLAGQLEQARPWKDRWPALATTE